MADKGRLLAGSGELIRPPRLEDAGLEDCALPPESIAEAFSLAAMAVSSRLPLLSLSDDEDDEGDAPLAPRGGCVDDAGPTCGAIPDALVGAGAGREGGADEVVVVGGSGGGGSDKVVVVGRGDEEDRVVVVGEELGKKLGQEKGCVEGIREEGEREKERRRMRW
jgi:hypothetical protein